MYYSCVALQITYYTLIFFVAFWAHWSFDESNLQAKHDRCKFANYLQSNSLSNCINIQFKNYADCV